MDEKLTVTEGSTHSKVDTLHKSSYECQHEDIRSSNRQEMTLSASGVDVEKAEHDFSQLNRQFSPISKQTSRVSKTGVTADVEQARSSAESD